MLRLQRSQCSKYYLFLFIQVLIFYERVQINWQEALEMVEHSDGFSNNMA
jgi:hypothetical protein